jgi:hypothetical protein
MQKHAIVTLCSVALNIVLLSFLLRCCTANPCPQQEATKVIEIDTVYADETQVKPTIQTKRPRLVKVTSPTVGDSRVSVSVDEESGCRPVATSSLCPSDTAIYADTLFEANAYRAIVEDTLIDNRISGRRFTFFNLTPSITKTVTITEKQKEKVRLYGGAFAMVRTDYVNPRQITGWSIGPSVLLTTPKGAAMSYSFDARNNGHSATFFYLIKLKR